MPNWFILWHVKEHEEHESKEIKVKWKKGYHSHSIDIAKLGKRCESRLLRIEAKR